MQGSLLIFVITESDSLTTFQNTNIWFDSDKAAVELQGRFMFQFVLFLHLKVLFQMGSSARSFCTKFSLSVTKRPASHFGSIFSACSSCLSLHMGHSKAEVVDCSFKNSRMRKIRKCAEPIVFEERCIVLGPQFAKSLSVRQTNMLSTHFPSSTLIPQRSAIPLCIP